MSSGAFKDPTKEYLELMREGDSAGQIGDVGLKPVWKYEWYPPQNTEEGKESPYYVEFLTRGGQTTWTLFKKHYFYSKELWNEMIKDNDYLLMSREGHPWNLGGGIVNERENVINMNTRGFLKLIVDGLNLQAKNL